VQLVRNQNNVGFARAVNEGLARAGGRNVFLLNPDAVVEPGTVARLVDVLDSSPRIGAVGGFVVSRDGVPEPHCASREISLPRQIAWRLGVPTKSLFLGAPCGPHGARETERLSGAALAVSRKVLDQIGPLDERYFLYYEDADWVLRIRQAGYLVACAT